MSRFTRAADLPLTDVARQDFYDLVENAKPAADLVDGDTLEVSADALQASLIMPRWKKFTIGHADLDTAAGTHTEALLTLGTWGIIHAVFCKHSTAFAGGSASAVTVSVGVPGDTDSFMSAFDIFQAVAAAAHKYNTIVVSNTTGSVPGTVVSAEFLVTGATAAALTAGSVDIYILYSEAK